MKRYLSLLLAVIMLISVICSAPVSVSAANGIDDRINSLLNLFPNGSYFSVDGKACRHESWNKCSNCSLTNIVTRSDLSSLGYKKDVDFIESQTCIAFSRFAFRYIFGKMLYESNYTQIASGEFSQSTFAYAKKGDIIEFRNSSGDTKHAAVFIGNANSSNATFYHANFQGTPKVSYGSWTYANMKDCYGKEGKAVILRAKNYDSVAGTTHTTHSYDTYVYYWDSHPHYKCYKCSCGEVKENTNENVLFDTCDACLKDYKATLSTEKSKFGIGEDVTIKWNEIPGATHYNLWLYKRNDDGTSTRISRDDKIKGTSITYSNLGEGKYFTDFATYNSNFWKQDHSDWFYSVADVIEFEVTNKILPGKPTLKVRPGTSEDYTQFTWRATSYTDNYTLHIFDIDNNVKLPLFTDITRLTYHVKLPAGNYRAHLASINDNLKDTSLWYTASDSITFTVTEGNFAPINSIEFNGKKYMLYDNSMPWEIAKSKCEELGGHLVTITSQEEMEIVKKLLPQGNRYGYWTGLADIDKDKIWNNITGEVSVYTYWAENQPDYFEDNEDCAIIQNEKDYRWNDVPHDCASYHIGFICEYEIEGPKIVVGDTDGDGKVSIKDATTIQKHVAGIITISDEKFDCADTDKDGKISVKDATRIQKFLAGIISSL